MALMDKLPISESIGVFVGITGFDWLTEGRAEPLKAIAVSIVVGVLIEAGRHWINRKRN